MRRGLDPREGGSKGAASHPGSPAGPEVATSAPARGSDGETEAPTGCHGPRARARQSQTAGRVCRLPATRAWPREPSYARGPARPAPPGPKPLKGMCERAEGKGMAALASGKKGERAMV